MYMINGFLKFAEKDNFDQGCDPDTALNASIDVSFTSDTIDGILDQVRSFFGVNDENLLLNSCEENGRIDIQITENNNGDQPSIDELERFKRGDLDLWAVTYSGVLYELTPAKF